MPLANFEWVANYATVHEGGFDERKCRFLRKNKSFPILPVTANLTKVMTTTTMYTITFYNSYKGLFINDVCFFQILNVPNFTRRGIKFVMLSSKMTK